jgi:ATP-dependent Clp protease ATP-binding subunit ClpC
MDNPLAERLERVLEMARDEASRLRHEYIGTEHLLLGIAGESASMASEALSSFGVTVERVRSGVATVIGLGPPSASPDDRGVTPRAKRVVDFAREEAVQRGSPQVEPEHLLLGITREGQGVAAQVLRDLQAPPESVREKMSVLLARRDGDRPQGT